jgi:uncharacterized membrane protein HdeD (DUF308 family)
MDEGRKLKIINIIEAILLIVLGIYSLSNPVKTIKAFTVIYGIVAIIIGIVDIYIYYKAEGFVGFGPITALIGGILSVVAGIILISNPNVGTWIFTIIFPIWFIAHAVSSMTHLNLIKEVIGMGYYWFTLVVDILGIVVGIMLVFNPQASFLTMSFLIGFYLLMLGINHVSLAFFDIGDLW